MLKLRIKLRGLYPKASSRAGIVFYNSNRSTRRYVMLQPRVPSSQAPIISQEEAMQ